jgi:hypothetical protein
MKLIKKEKVTLQLIDHIIEMIKHVKEMKTYPPKLRLFKQKDVEKFKELDKFGEYSVEFILVIMELIMTQEKTNYPTGTLNLKLFETFKKQESIFKVIGAATFNGR